MGNNRKLRRHPIVRSIRKIIKFFRQLLGIKRKPRRQFIEDRQFESAKQDGEYSNESIAIELPQPDLPEPDLWANYQLAKLGDLLTHIDWQAQDLDLPPQVALTRSIPVQNLNDRPNGSPMTLGELLDDIQWEQSKTSVYTKVSISHRQPAFNSLLN